MEKIYSYLFKSIPFFLGVVFIAIFFLTLTLNGARDIDYYGNTLNRRTTGPFESSNSRGRYALTKSIVEEKSIFLSRDLAAFSLPDVVSYEGKYFSLFTPGVSFIAVPFYVLGRAVGSEQVVTYMVNTTFSLGSVLLILILVKRLTGSLIAGAISALTFLLATNAFVYSQTLTQHPITVFLLLLVTYFSLYVKGGLSFFISGILYGIAILVDLPNALIFAPFILLYIGRSLGYSTNRSKIKISFDFRSLFLLVGLIPFLVGFGYYNYVTTGSPFRVAQVIGRVTSLDEIEVSEQEVIKDRYEEVAQFRLPFDTRLIPNGLYILIASNERGIFYYSPVLVLGILGLILSFRERGANKFATIVLASSAVTVVTYSMFGDPWGGWSFGARYMIPVNAMLSIFVGVSIVKYAKKPWFTTVFLIFLFYSLAVNALGALTTSNIPPKQEAINLVDPVPYTYKYNLEYVSNNLSSSYIYNSFLYNSFSLAEYIIFLVLAEGLVFTSLYYFYFVVLAKKQ